jgi:hypothetical protein
MQEQEVSRSLQVTFFLEGLFSWQKWQSKPQNRAISDTIPSSSQVIVLVQPLQPCRSNRGRPISIGTTGRIQRNKQQERGTHEKSHFGDKKIFYFEHSCSLF